MVNIVVSLDGPAMADGATSVGFPEMALVPDNGN